MENPIRYSRGSLHHLSVRQRRSGYEPSDTENERYEKKKPWGELDRKSEEDSDSEEPNVGLEKSKNPSSLRLNRRRSSKFDKEESSPAKASLAANPAQRRHSKSPYKTCGDDGNARSPRFGGSDLGRHVSPLPQRPDSDIRKNVSPFSKSERRRHVSPFKPVREVHHVQNDESVRKQNHRQASNESSEAKDKSNYSNRSKSAPRGSLRDKEQPIKYDHRDQKRGVRSRTPPPLPRNITPRKDREGTHKNAPSVGEINEMVANAKISKNPVVNFDSTDSIAAGDIFFSRDFAAMTMQKIIFPKTGGEKAKISGSYQRPKGNIVSNYNTQVNSSSTILPKTHMRSASGASRQSSNASDASGRSTASTRKFTANRQKSQSGLFFCINKGSCGTSKKSVEKERAFDEASFIEKAFVVENLRQFWADKHRPSSLNGFTCHKQEAQLLKQLASHASLPHILLKGPPGSGKRSLTMALLREIYGEASQNITHDLRYFQIQETRLTQVVVPLTSSPHHVELDVYLEPNARYALMALVKQISSNHAVTTEISTINFKADYTVMVLYDVDKADESIQHLIKWVMDCYTDVCKLILCCEDDIDILEPVKERCKVIKVDAPITHQVMEVLIQIARKENFDLSMNFAAKIANKSKQNLRKAIMALEACKWHNYPFAEDQPIPMGWEEVIIELAAETLADPSHKRLFFIRGKFQKLLVEFVHPKLILLKLVEQFLKGVEGNLKRELFYWHAYYDKRLPEGTSALLKLEEFVAKFMGLHRKSCSNRQ